MSIAIITGTDGLLGKESIKFLWGSYMTKE